VAKAFNTIFATGQAQPDGGVDAYVAADDPKAKQEVISLAEAMGFSPLEMPPMGSDGGGRSVWVLVANGARLSMIIGITTMLIAVTIGVTVGGLAGFFGGRTDSLLMRFVDLMLTIPFLFIVLVAAQFFGGGELVPLSALVELDEGAAAPELRRYDRLPSITISASLAEGYDLGSAITYMQEIAAETLPPEASLSFSGQSRQFLETSGGIAVTFAMALLIVYLVLAAQFESFRSPFIIMLTVPLSIAGGLGALWLDGSTLNIYSQVGLVTLIGLITKHGILIVEFANNLQREGQAKRKAIETAAGIRLRPILMTTAAMVLGVVPLITASGAGAVSRFNMGLVIATGIAIGTLFTLLVVPAMYMLLATDHAGQPAEAARRGAAR